MREKRACERFIIKLPVTISSVGKKVDGTTVRLSQKGMFVRTQRSFVEGSAVDIELLLTNAATCKLKGVVKYARNCDLMKRQNGMGIELTKKNEAYEKCMSEVEK